MKNVKPGHVKPIVCLDAGHYDKYNRSPVVAAYYESDMNWKLHNYLATELEAYGIQVKKTRTTQAKDRGLSARGKASAGCDLFLSIHSNACNTERVDRPVAIVQLDGKGDALGRILVDCIREVMRTNDAGRVNTRKGSGGSEYYGVLRGAAQVGTMGLILEHSFHTNTRAATWLLEDANLRKLAKAEAATVAAWFGLNELSSTAPSPAPQVKPEPAKDKDANKAGTYVVRSSDGSLNLRAGAAADKPLIETMPNGAKVRCYGYHTGAWLYVMSETGNAGFCHSGYLVKA